MTAKLSIWGGAILMGFLLFASMWRIDSVPPLWWDEGWTVSIARNWLEQGQYVRLLKGQVVSAGLGASPTVIAPIYLSFRLFGVGVTQARMVGALFTLISLALIYCIARRLYNPSIALASVLVLAFLPAYIELFPPYEGRQVLAEMPALCFLLAGYAAIFFFPHYPFWALCIAIVTWAIALTAKLQVVPFWIFSMSIPLAASMYRRNWIFSLCWSVALAGSLIGSRVLNEISGLLLQSKTDFADPITGVYQVAAMVGSIPSRMFALIVTVLFGIPTLIGLCYGVWDIFRRGNVMNTHVEQVKASLLFLALSWFGWFVVFSVGWVRYVFPVTFIGSIFVAAMMYDLTRGYSVAYTIQQSFAFLTGRGFNKNGVGALLVLTIVVTSVPRTARALYKTYILDADTSVQQAAEFLNSQIPSGALIETYDSELFFLLNRPYHYPPDQIHVELIRRTFLYDDSVIIDYDPLAANPDYLVVGPHSKQWRLYDDVLKTGAFRLLRSYPRYLIYERVR